MLDANMVFYGVHPPSHYTASPKYSSRFPSYFQYFNQYFPLFPYKCNHQVTSRKRNMYQVEKRGCLLWYNLSKMEVTGICAHVYLCTCKIHRKRPIYKDEVKLQKIAILDIQRE